MARKDAHWDQTAERPWVGRVENGGRRLLYRLAAGLLPSRPGGAFSWDEVRRVLIVKEPYRMGDLLQITPTLRALKARFPSLYLALVCQDRNEPLFRTNPNLDRLFVYEKRAFNRNPALLAPFLRAVRSGRFDMAVTLETERTHLTNDLIAYLSGARWRLRTDGADLGNADSNAFYNLTARRDPACAHEVDKNFAVFRPFGLSLGERALQLVVPAVDLSAARRIASSFPAAPWIAIHPGSYKIQNRWPLQRYFAVAGALAGEGKPAIFVLGPSESGWKEEVEARGFPVVTGISVLVLAGLFQSVGRALVNDTGVMHVAGAVGARTLALFGETEPERWKPPGGSVRALRGADRRVASITPEEVLRALLG